MAGRDPSIWEPDAPTGPADSIATELANRMAAPPAAPGEAIDWAALASTWEREAAARGAGPEAAFLLGEAARIHDRHLGDPAAALGLLRRSVESDPSWLPGLRAARRLAVARGDLPLAAHLLPLEARHTLSPGGRAELELAASRTLAALGQGEASRAALERAAAADPGGFAVAEEQGLRAAASGDRRGLAEAWQRCAVAAGTPRLGAHLLAAAAGLLADGVGDLEGAAPHALRALSLAPDDPLVRATARRHAHRLEDQDALAALQRADAEAAPAAEAPFAWLDLAATLCGPPGRFAEAAEALERARATAPAEPLVLAELARLHEARGDWRAASDALAALATAHLDGTGPAHLAEAVAAWLRRAELEEERLDEPGEAITCCRAILAVAPGHRGALATLGRLCAREEDWEGLLDAFQGEAAAATAPLERAQRTYKAAEVVERRLGDRPRAAALYREALALDPRLLAARIGLERTFEQEGQWAELVELLEADLADLAAGPEVAARRLRLTLLQRRAELLDDSLGDAERAMEAWAELLEASPSHLPALSALGRLHAAAGEWEAVGALFRAEADAAADPVAAAGLVRRIAELCERRLGRVDEAIGAYQEVLTLDPADLRALAALARLHRERGEDERLVEVLRAEAAVRAAPAVRAALLCEVGRRWAHRLGERGHAVEAYEDALRARPGFPAAAQALDRLYAAEGRWDDLAALRREEADRAGHGPARAHALLGLALLAIDRRGDPAEARSLVGEAAAAAPGHPIPLLLDLRLHAAVPARRAALRQALAEGAPPPAAAAWLVAAAADLPAAEAPGLLRRAALQAPGSALLEPELDALAEAGSPVEAARHAERRRASAAGPAERAYWALRAAEAWTAAGDAPAARAAVDAALGEAPGSLPALRAARAAAEARGDLAAARALLRSEASALQDRHAAASAFFQAGALSERLGDPEDAALDYRLAAELDPLDAAPLDRLEALRAGTGAADLLAAREARARAERDPVRAAEAWLAVARAALAGEAGAPGALAALDRAVESHPGAAAARELRARLRAAEGRAGEAVLDYEAALAAGGPPAALAPLHLAAGVLCQDQLADPGRALAHLEAALAAQPDGREALERLARLHGEAGRAAPAAEALRRLLTLPGLAPAQAADHHVALGRLEARLGDEARALAHTARAQELVPGHAEALRLMVELERRRAEPRTLAAALEAAAAAAAEPAFRAEARLEAARLQAGPLNQRGRAVELLRAAVEDVPGYADARAELALAYEEASPALAVEEHRRLLEADPLRVESWAALARLFERQRAHDRVYVAATVLRWLGAPPPGPSAERLLLDGDRQVLPAPPALSAGDLELLRHPGDRGPLAGLLAAAGGHLADAVRGGAVQAGDPARADHPFRRGLGEATRALGVGGGDWELYPTAPGRLLVDPSERSAVLCGTDLPRRTTAREQRFLLGRVAARLWSGSMIADLLDDARLAEVLAAAVALSEPGWHGLGAAPEELARRVARLPRRVRKAMEGPAGQVAAGPRLDLAAARRAAAATADRFGLALCGDVPTALALLARGGPAATPPDGPPLVEAVRACPPALALLAFAASEAHLALRQKLRVAIA